MKNMQLQRTFQRFIQKLSLTSEIVTSLAIITSELNEIASIFETTGITFEAKNNLFTRSIYA